MSEQSMLPAEPAFERKIHQGLMTPSAFVRAVLESGDVGSHPGTAASYGIHDWASDYAEPGYSVTREDRGILFGNWNAIDRYDAKTQTRVKVSDAPERFAKIAESAGYDIEWSDEWSTCHGCNKAVRTSPDSYSYTPSYAIVNECELLCHECLLDDTAAYLEELTDNPNACVTESLARQIDFEAEGFTKVNTDRYESGLHPGMNDNPQAITKELQAKGYDRILFVQTEQSQFYITFDVYAGVLPGETDNDQE